MPNWCANRLRVTGLAKNVSKVRARFVRHTRGQKRRVSSCF